MSHVPKPRNRVDNTPRQPSELLTQPLLIRLQESIGPLPSGLIYSLPRFEAEKLIMRRKATAVGPLGTMADLSLTQEEFAEATTGKGEIEWRS